MKLSLHIFRPSCALTSQLSLKMCANLPSKMISHRNCDPPNLDFCNTLQCFSRFFIIQGNRFQDASQVPFEVQISQDGSKILSRASQDAPKTPPRAPKIAPRAPKIPPGDRKKPPKRRLPAPKTRPGGSKRLPRGSKRLPRGS